MNKKNNSTTIRQAALAAKLCLTLAAVLTGASPIAPLSAQMPTLKPIGILRTHTLPPLDDKTLFSARVTTEQSFVSMTGHPQAYRLDLGGNPIQPLYIGAQIDYSGSGLHRDLYAQVCLGTLVPIARHWFLSGGIDGGFNYRHYRLEDIVTEHPNYGEALADEHRQFTVGAQVGAVYGRTDIGRLAFGTQVHLTADGDDIASVTYLRYKSPEDGLRKTVFIPWLEHGFYSRERTRHYYKAGIRTELFSGRFFIETAYETSKDVQTAAAAIGITICKGLALHYALDLPFRFTGGLCAGAHTIAISYDLRRKPFQQPRLAGGR